MADSPDNEYGEREEYAADAAHDEAGAHECENDCGRSCRDEGFLQDGKTLCIYCVNADAVAIRVQSGEAADQDLVEAERYFGSMLEMVKKQRFARRVKGRSDLDKAELAAADAVVAARRAQEHADRLLARARGVRDLVKPQSPPKSAEEQFAEQTSQAVARLDKVMHAPVDNVVPMARKGAH